MKYVPTFQFYIMGFSKWVILDQFDEGLLLHVIFIDVPHHNFPKRLSLVSMGVEKNTDGSAFMGKLRE